MENFILTPASHTTTIPPAPTKKAVPRSGWVTTKNTGTIKAPIGCNKYFNLLTSQIEILMIILS